MPPLGIGMGPGLAFGGTAAFSPLSIADLALYHDGDTAPVVSSHIPSWTDLSGNARHATNATQAQQPIPGTAINGKATVHFSGAQILTTPAFALGPFTIYLVVRLTGTAGILYERGAASADQYLYGSQGATYLVSRSAVLSDYNLTANWAVDNAVKVVRGRFDGTNAGHTLAINGATQTPVANPAASNPGTGTQTNVLNLGARAGLALPTTGDYRRVLLYSRALSTTEDAAVTAWLRADAGV